MFELAALMLGVVLSLSSPRRWGRFGRASAGLQPLGTASSHAGRPVVALESTGMCFLSVLVEKLHALQVKCRRKVVSQLHHYSMRVRRLTCTSWPGHVVVLVGAYGMIYFPWIHWFQLIGIGLWLFIILCDVRQTHLFTNVRILKCTLVPTGLHYSL